MVEVLNDCGRYGECSCSSTWIMKVAICVWNSIRIVVDVVNFMFSNFVSIHREQHYKLLSSKTKVVVNEE